MDRAANQPAKAAEFFEMRSVYSGQGLPKQSSPKIDNFVMKSINNFLRYH
jgi:hypothetical protein